MTRLLSKKIVGILFGFVLCVIVCGITASAETVVTGSCGAEGDNVSWVLDDDGTLTIYGNGKMADCKQSESPSYYNRGYAINKVVIKQGVSSVGNGAFKSCKGLTEIEIPNSVTEIGSETFRSCSNISKISLPESVTSIGSYAFSYCTSITDFVIPEAVTDVSDFAFRGCSNLANVTIPDGVTRIGSYAFADCTALTTISLPDSLNLIMQEAFSDCKNLQRCDLPKKVSSISLRAFSGCKSLTEIEIPYGITYIDTGTFAGCTGLEKVTIPNSVTKIYESAFSGCTALTDIVIPDSVTILKNNVFYKCSSLRSVNIPKGIDTIDYRTFSGCVSLTDITIPENITTISYEAFYGCSGLTYITIPESVTSIGSDAFHECPKLLLVLPEALNYTPNKSAVILYSVDESDEVCITGMGIIDSVDGKNMEFHTDIPKEIHGRKVTSIHLKKWGFSLFSVTIPESITYIDTDDFNRQNLSSVTVDENNPVYCSVDGVLFNKAKTKLIYCPRRKYYCIPASVSSFESRAISAEDTVAYYMATSKLSSALNDAYVTGVSVTTENGIATIQKAVSGYYIRDLDIPEELYGCTVASISNSAFYNDHYFTSVSLPDSVTTIGSSAFSKCNSLSSVRLPANLTSIQTSLFSGCTSLERVIIPDKVTEILGLAFNNCSALTSINIPANVEKMATDSIFRGCTSLKDITVDKENRAYCSIGNVLFSKDMTEILYYLPQILYPSYVIPDGVTTIGNYAFSKCSNLINVTFPQSISSIGRYAFENCDGLTTLNFSRSQEKISIGNYAFRNCSSLTCVILPEQVNSIGDSAFRSCSALERFFYPQSVSYLGTNAIPDTAARAAYDTSGEEVTISSIILGSNMTSLDIPGTINGYQVVAVNPEYRELVGEHICVARNSVCGLCGKPVKGASYAAVVDCKLADNIIGVNFIVSLSDDLINNSTAKMKFTVNGTENVIPVRNATSIILDGETVYSFTSGVPAAEMTDKITALIVADGYESSVYTCTVRNCINDKLNDEGTTSDEAAKLKAMLNYGAEAQKYFDHSTNDLANSILSDTDRSVAPISTSELARYKCTYSDNDADIDFVGYTISLEDTVVAKLYFTGKALSPDDFTVLYDGNAVSRDRLSLQTDDKGTYLAISDIIAGDFARCFTVRIGKVKISNISVYSYLWQCLDNGTGPVDVIYALYAYNEAA